MIIGVNTGGTFTDFVYKQGDTWGVYKVLSTPSNFAEAVLNGLNYFSYVNPCHEQKVRELLAPFGLELSLSHEILAEFREFEERGHPLKGESREKTPPRCKKIHFFSLDP